MIIEFIGPPGAGKTTLLPTVIEFFQAQGVAAFSVVDAARLYARRTFLGKFVYRMAPRSLVRPLLWRVFYLLSFIYRVMFLARNPRLLSQVLSHQWRRPKEAEARRRKVLHWFIRFAGYYEFLAAHARPDEVLVFDEGFVHRVVQLFASGVEKPDKNKILAYVDLLPLPDIVIYAQASPEICNQRIFTRGLWERFRNKSEAEISQFVFNAYLVVDLTVDYIKSKGWTVIEVDNGTGGLPAAKAELRRDIAQVSNFTDLALEL